MNVIAWNKGNHHSDGNGNGVKIDAHDRDAFFRREWIVIFLELEGESALVEINIDKDIFGTQTAWN